MAAVTDRPQKKSPGHEGRAINGAERKLDTPF